MQVEIKDKLYKDISSYCQINELDVTEYINELLKKEFMIDKYGERPEILDQPKVVTKKEEKPEPEIDAVKEMEKLLEEESKRVVHEAAKDVIKKLEGEGWTQEVEPINEPKNEPINEPKKHRKLK